MIKTENRKQNMVNRRQKTEDRKMNLKLILDSRFLILNSSHLRGFTLVELLVAVAVFSSAVIIGVGALYSAQQINVRLQATRTVMDSLNTSLEIMVRDVRYGSSFYCGAGGEISNSRKSCNLASGGGEKIFFNVGSELGAGSGDRMVYYLNTDNQLVEGKSSDGGFNFVYKKISSDEIIIDNLHFYVSGANKTSDVPSDKDQPVITIIISGKTKPFGKLPSVPFVLQTSVTTRNID